nr:immunoglobulin heavy chain junction region [Macaca mulatta]MOW87988.1 immunoglobulin heavy chain junction region [Macaca mulatta]MOW91079.1 immunoglobulin heavy chain junction region [Macaca mulatta]MOW93089.1 immunoglobulin heavy chain junction region [Macaca mulatta]
CAHYEYTSFGPFDFW